MTAVENNKDIANIYQEFFPNDKVIIADAHQYLLDHYKEFDFIWSSPPCPTHTTLQRLSVYSNSKWNKNRNALYPDMRLYQEIILLKNYSCEKTKWIVENVKPFYDYLIEPAIVLGRHPFWSNFEIRYFDIKSQIIKSNKTVKKEIAGGDTLYGFDVKKYKINNKRQILRNLVNPEIGLHIFNEARGIKIENEKTLFD